MLNDARSSIKMITNTLFRSVLNEQNLLNAALQSGCTS